MYSSLVHTNNSISKIEKFWYLKGSLKGEPYNMVKHMLTDENYTAAWKLLTDYYENPRELFRSQMHLFSSQSKITEECAHNIQSLLCVSRECRQALTNFDIDLKHCDPILIYFIVQRLPAETVGLWETCMGTSKSLPTFDKFEHFLDTRIKTLEAVAENRASSSKGVSTASKPTCSNMKPSYNSSKPKRVFHVKNNQNNNSHKPNSQQQKSQSSSCCICQDNHILRKCPKFLSMSTIARRKAIEGKRVCYNCLANDHLKNNCYSIHNCRCGARHHTLLHIESNPGSMNPTIETSIHQPEGSDPVLTHITRFASRQVLLSTAIVNVKGANGEFVQLRALIDKGSEASLITHSATRTLNLPQQSIKARISGISDVTGDSCNKLVNLDLKSNVNDYEININAFVMQKLTGMVPQKSVVDYKWPHIQEIPLADPNYFKSYKIDLLLGSDVYAEIICDGLRKCKGFPTAQNTEFGWIIMGAIDSSDERKLRLKAMVTKVEIDRLMQQFWDIDTVSPLRDMNSDERWCDNFYAETTRKISSGRYLVRLPFKSYNDNEAVLGKSHQIAVNQFIQLEKRFIKNPNLHVAYIKEFNDYISQGQMSLVTTSEEQCSSIINRQLAVKCTYLPHHAVHKQSSTTTQLRIVFDASRKTSNGKSLNDILYPGPVLHNDLPSILTNWRTHKIAFTADLKQMFRQILVNSEDAQFQRVVWRDKQSDPLRDYYLKTVTFGTTSAPYLAMRTIKQLCMDSQQMYPLAVHTLLDCTYVDDVFGGSDEIEQVLELQKQLIATCRYGQFHLRKWVSNNEQVLQAVPKEDREINLPFAINMEESVKTLGIIWYPITDTFKFRFNFQLPSLINMIITKRSILSIIARLYDPLGFITPVILPAKLIMRDLWLENVDWDDEVSSDLQHKWLNFI